MACEQGVGLGAERGGTGCEGACRVRKLVAAGRSDAAPLGDRAFAHVTHTPHAAYTAQQSTAQHCTSKHSIAQHRNRAAQTQSSLSPTSGKHTWCFSMAASLNFRPQSSHSNMGSSGVAASTARPRGTGAPHEGTTGDEGRRAGGRLPKSTASRPQWKITHFAPTQSRGRSQPMPRANRAALRAKHKHSSDLPPPPPPPPPPPTQPLLKDPPPPPPPPLPPPSHKKHKLLRARTWGRQQLLRPRARAARAPALPGARAARGRRGGPPRRRRPRPHRQVIHPAAPAAAAGRPPRPRSRRCRCSVVGRQRAAAVAPATAAAASRRGGRRRLWVVPTPGVVPGWRPPRTAPTPTAPAPKQQRPAWGGTGREDGEGEGGRGRGGGGGAFERKL
jgi:hypothetical protein